MDISKVYSNLKSLIVGTKTTVIDSELDQSIGDVFKYRSHQNITNYIDVVKSLISKSSATDLSYLQTDTFGTSLGLYGQNRRFAKYNLYRSIVKMIPYCKRALDILTDNIISPDDITKVVIDVKPLNISLEKDESETSVLLRIKNLMTDLNLEKDICSIVKNTLKYGDYFYEITTTSSYLSSKSSLVHENVLDPRSLDSTKSSKEEVSFVSKDKKVSHKFVLDFSSSLLEESKQNANINLSNVKVVYHIPANVIKLQTKSMPVCLGYLVFPEEAFNPTYQIESQEINNLCNSILSRIRSKVSGAGKIKDVPDLKDVLTRMMKSTETFSTEIRYVPPNLMGSFSLKNEETAPYGRSIFYPCEFSAKLLISLETALAIQRLSRSTEKRKISVEIGLPRDAKKAVEMLKEQFKKRKITIDSFGSIDTIPSTITTFEDIYVPQRDGKPFVDVNTFDQGNVDTARKVEEIKYIRDQLVSSFGIPAPFLNIEENTSWRTTLTEENILFARSIVSFQKIFSSQLQDMLVDVSKASSPELIEPLGRVNVVLPPPKSLQFEREAKYLQDAVTMIQSLSDVGVPKEYSARKFLSQIDWDDVKKFEVDRTIEKKIAGSKDEEDNSSLSGGFK